MSVRVEDMLRLMVEEAQTDPAKIREFIRKLGLDTAAIRRLLDFCQKNTAKDLPKRNYGLVHQDLINVLGERLGFKVTSGDYEKGPDGIWSLKEALFTVESKASSSWLKIEQASNQVKEHKAASGLVICKDFTADNIQAAAGFGNVRLLTTEGLCKLTELKDEGVLTADNVLSILIPQETVKLDYLVDILYKIKHPPSPPPPAPPEGVVAVFPSKPSGVGFLLDNKAWAWVKKPSRKIDYFALYVTKPTQGIAYYGQVKGVTPQEEHPALKRDDRKGRYVIEVESVEKLDTPIPLAPGDSFRNVRYTTLDKLLKAKTTKEIR